MSARTLRPVGPHLLVRPDAPPKEANGILLPETWAKPPGTGTIVSIGLSRTVLVASPDGLSVSRAFVSTDDFHVGQRVAFRWIDGERRVIEDSGEKLCFMRLDELVGVVE